MRTLLLTTTLAVLGIISIVTHNKYVLESYLWLSSVLLIAVSIGGVVQYSLQTNRDFREIYREKDKLQKEKIIQLEEELKKRA